MDRMNSFDFDVDRHELERLQILVLIGHFGATRKLQAAADLCRGLKLGQHLRFDNLIQTGGDVVELLRIGGNRSN